MKRSQYKWLAAIMFAFILSAAIPGRAQEPDPAGAPYEVSLPPAQLTLPAGAWITVRVNQTLSSDRNRPGDDFTATMAQPLVVSGLVIARRGQTVGGRVADAQLAGRARGTSRLGLELTEISIVDGQQLPVLTQLIEYQGGTSVGQDATAVAAGTGLGAAIGAVAGGGRGAGIGAMAGAAAATIGVLVTRGRPTVVYPESVLTFRTLAPLTISTERSEQAFQPVSQQDYEPQRLQRRAGPPPARVPRPAYYSNYYYWPYRPFYSGPRVFIYSRPHFSPAYRPRVFRPRVFIYSAPRFHHPPGHYRRR